MKNYYKSGDYIKIRNDIMFILTNDKCLHNNEIFSYKIVKVSTINSKPFVILRIWNDNSAGSYIL